jgi:hypothetical protein
MWTRGDAEERAMKEGKRARCWVEWAGGAEVEGVVTEVEGNMTKGVGPGVDAGEANGTTASESTFPFNLPSDMLSPVLTS